MFYLISKRIVLQQNGKNHYGYKFKDFLSINKFLFMIISKDVSNDKRSWRPLEKTSKTQQKKSETHADLALFCY